MQEKAMNVRISPAKPPFAAEIQTRLDRLMPPGVPPLALFTTLARDQRLFDRFMNGGLLDRGHLTLRQRELVIDRVTARCGSEYEWGVHIAFFAARVELNDVQQKSLVHGGPGDSCWSAEDRLVLELCDSLHDTNNVADPLWAALASHFTEAAIIELVMLVGFYHTVSYLTAALRLPLEDFAARFPLP
jgi:alkylhydroperoxidase family enzyme